VQKIRLFINTFSPTVSWCIVFALIGLTHANYIANGFTWLDHGDLELGRAVLPLRHLFEAFLTRFGETGFYRPLVTIVHSLDAAFYDQWAPGYHLTNVLLHILVTGAFALFLSQFLSLNRSEYQLATLLAGIHPLSWLPVGAISYRPELLAALFVFLTVFFHARARTSGNTQDTLLAILCLTLGFFSKESTLIWTPALIVVWEVCTQKEQSKPLLFIYECLTLLTYICLRWSAVPELWQASTTALPINEAVGTRLSALGMQLLNLINPTLPTLSDATPIRTLFGFSALATALILLGALLSLLFRWRKQPMWPQVLLFTAIALSPALNIIPLPRFQSPHYGYLASFGFAMAVSVTLHWAQKQIRPIQTGVYAGIALWTLIAMTTTTISGSRFANDQTLFEPETTHDPKFSEGHYYLGLHFKKLGDIKRAATAYEAALKKHPNTLVYVDGPSAAINLSEIRFIQQRFTEADDLLSVATVGASVNQVRYIAYNRALIVAQQGFDERVVTLLKDPDLMWKRPEPLFLLSQALGHLGRTSEAAMALRQSLPLLNQEQQQSVQFLIQKMGMVQK
jgi:tetratricopeptide (TPR) repeat protein